MPITEEEGTRKLAAIMFTDIRDFSKKMGENEEAGLQLLRIHDAKVNDLVIKHGGVVIKSIGDSFMVDFSSAVNALRCAIEVQETFWEYNKNKREIEKIEIRIGIHLGEVTVVGNDVFGDGVNIAARIEAITDPTRICISGDVYKQVRKKMHLRVYEMGTIELKNIAEPVEVYEVLLESIPELSEASESARQRPSQRKAETIAKQEEEEAKRVEVAKVKAGEDGKRKEADEFFKQAEAEFQAGNLEKAEDYIQQVYRVVTIHYNAQMLTLQIEEDKAKREEEERKRRLREDRKRKEEERDQRIQEKLAVVLQFVEKEQFDQAFDSIQQVYTVDPKNAQAKQIEEQIKQAIQATKDLEAAKAREAAEREQEEMVRKQKEALETLRARPISLQRKTEEKKKSRIWIYIGVGAVAVAAIIGVIIAIPFLQENVLSSTSTIAMLPFKNEKQGQEGILGYALTATIGKQLAQIADLHIISVTSTSKLSPKLTTTAELGQALNADELVTGTFRQDGEIFLLHVKLIEVATDRIVWEKDFDGKGLSDFEPIAGTVALDIMKEFGMDLTISPGKKISSLEMFEKYWKAQMLLNLGTIESTDEALIILMNLHQAASGYATIYASYGLGLIQKYELGGESEPALLDSAYVFYERATALTKNLADVHLLQTKIARHNHFWDIAGESITKGLALEPSNPECIREQIYLYLLSGDLEKASERAARAVKIDPYNPKSYIVQGLAQHYKRNYTEALKFYNLAVSNGAKDSLINARYRMSAWVGADQETNAVRFCQQYIDRAPDIRKIELYYQWGQALQSAGKSLDAEAVLLQGDKLAVDIIFKDRRTLASTTSKELLESFALLQGTHALVQARLGRAKEAVRSLDEALKLSPTSAYLCYYQARVSTINNDTLKAIASLAKAVELQYVIQQILDPDFFKIAMDARYKAAIIRKKGKN
ncbi:MAG: adenylate/guanylate cyclase domain-containing protein [bacterium]